MLSIFFSLIYLLTNNIGIDQCGVCSLKQGTQMEVTVVLVLILIFPYAIFTMIYILKKRKKISQLIQFKQATFFESQYSLEQKSLFIKLNFFYIFF